MDYFRPIVRRAKGRNVLFAGNRRRRSSPKHGIDEENQDEQNESPIYIAGAAVLHRSRMFAWKENNNGRLTRRSTVPLRVGSLRDQSPSDTWLTNGARVYQGKLGKIERIVRGGFLGNATTHILRKIDEIGRERVDQLFRH